MLCNLSWQLGGLWSWCSCAVHDCAVAGAPRLQSPIRSLLLCCLRVPGILEAWSGIFNGMSREKADEFLKPASPHLIEYIETIYNDQANQDDGERAPAAGCRG